MATERARFDNFECFLALQIYCEKITVGHAWFARSIAVIDTTHLLTIMLRVAISNTSFIDGTLPATVTADEQQRSTSAMGNNVTATKLLQSLITFQSYCALSSNLSALVRHKWNTPGLLQKLKGGCNPDHDMKALFSSLCIVDNVYTQPYAMHC